MKLVLPMRSSASGKAVPHETSIPTSDNNETFETLLNVQIVPVDQNMTTDSSVIQTVPVKIIGTSETTTKGVRRVLIKTELPYGALKEGPDGTYIKDAARSGGAISAHMVITAPKELVSDLSVTGPVQASAIGQLLMVKTLLMSLASNGDSFISADGTTEVSTPALQPWAGGGYASFRMVVTDEGFLEAVLRDEFSILQKTAIGRGLLGLKPFGSDVQNINVKS